MMGVQYDTAVKQRFEHLVLHVGQNDARSGSRKFEFKFSAIEKAEQDGYELVHVQGAGLGHMWMFFKRPVN